jgi:hypothetical protein
MAFDLILYAVAAMILYDFSLHIDDILKAFGKTSKAKHPLGSGRLFDHLSKGNELKREKIYQTFWSIYWGTASLLIVIYIITL